MAAGASPGTLSFVIFVAIVVIAAAVLILLALGRRQEPPPGRSDPDSDGGTGLDLPPRTPPESPRGGLPLPDASPARARLRDHARLAERRPLRQRRPAREPERRPVRTLLART
jgi:hypothetical protein